MKLVKVISYHSHDYALLHGERDFAGVIKVTN